MFQVSVRKKSIDSFCRRERDMVVDEIDVQW